MMPNGQHQMQHLINEATDRVAEKGRGAETQDIILAGFGYLAYEVHKPQWWSLKRVVPASFAIGTAFGGGVLAGVFRLLGIGES